MRGPEIKVGRFYRARLSGALQVLQVTAREGAHGYLCLNPVTSRIVHVKSARRFKEAAWVSNEPEPVHVSESLSAAPTRAGWVPGMAVEVRCRCGTSFRSGVLKTPKDNTVSNYWDHAMKCEVRQSFEQAKGRV